MHPEVDISMRSLLSTSNPTTEIDCDREPARSLLWEALMRTTTLALLCFAGCAQIGERGGDDDSGPDSGVDGSTAPATCEQMDQRTMDLTVSSEGSFNGLPSGCWRLVGRLTVNSSSVTSLTKLGDLREVKSLVIEGTALPKIDSKSPIEVVEAISIRNNSTLTDVANIVPRSTVQSIVIENNSALVALGGVEKAQVVAAETRIVNNANLTTLNLGAATRLEGGLVVQDNPKITTIDLHSLDSVGAMTIRHNIALTTLTSSVKYVHGTLAIENNTALRSLGTFGQDVNINPGGLSIVGNTQLQDVGQLARAAYVLAGVVISGNGQLPTTKAHDIGCCVDIGGFAVSGTNGSCQGNHWCQNQHNCYYGL